MQCDFPFDWTNNTRLSVQNNSSTSSLLQSTTCDDDQGHQECDSALHECKSTRTIQSTTKTKKRKTVSQPALDQCLSEQLNPSENLSKRIYTKKRVLLMNSEPGIFSTQSNEDQVVLETDKLSKQSHVLSSEQKKKSPAGNVLKDNHESNFALDSTQSKTFLNPIGNKTQMLNDPLDDLGGVKTKDIFLHRPSSDPTQRSSFSGEIRDLILKQLSLCIRTSSLEEDISKNHSDHRAEMCAQADLFTQVLDMEEQTYLKQKKKDLDQFLDTDSLISKLPYKKMLLDIFGGNLRGNLQMIDIPYVTRVYEESFMRESLNSSERECAKGKLCECMFIDKKQPFVGVEFLLPGEKQQRTSNMCVLCYRQMTQQLYYDVIFDKCEFPGCIQKFGNIHSEKGEYLLDAMLIAAPTAPSHIMPIPIVSHQRNRYTVYVSGGIKRLSQSRVYFQNTPSYLTDLGM